MSLLPYLRWSKNKTEATCIWDTPVVAWLHCCPSITVTPGGVGSSDQTLLPARSLPEVTDTLKQGVEDTPHTSSVILFMCQNIIICFQNACNFTLTHISGNLMVPASLGLTHNGHLASETQKTKRSV